MHQQVCAAYFSDRNILVISAVLGKEASSSKVTNHETLLAIQFQHQGLDPYVKAVRR